MKNKELYICPRCGKNSTVSIGKVTMKAGDNGFSKPQDTMVMDCCRFAPLFKPKRVS